MCEKEFLHGLSKREKTYTEKMCVLFVRRDGSRMKSKHGYSKSRRPPLGEGLPTASESESLPRQCMIVANSRLARNVADVEMNKFLAQVSYTTQRKLWTGADNHVQLFRRYTVIIQDPSQPIKRISCFAIGYSDLKVSLIARKGEDKFMQ